MDGRVLRRIASQPSGPVGRAIDLAIAAIFVLAHAAFIVSLV